MVSNTQLDGRGGGKGEGTGRSRAELFKWTSWFNKICTVVLTSEHDMNSQTAAPLLNLESA